MSREKKLLQLIYVLWHELSPDRRNALEPGVRQDGLGWAIPPNPFAAEGAEPDADEILTVERVSFELGLTQSGFRNWQYRYGLKPIRPVRRGEPALFRWGDVQAIRSTIKTGKRRDDAA